MSEICLKTFTDCSGVSISDSEQVNTSQIARSNSTVLFYRKIAFEKDSRISSIFNGVLF